MQGRGKGAGGEEGWETRGRSGCVASPHAPHIRPRELGPECLGKTSTTPEARAERYRRACAPATLETCS